MRSSLRQQLPLLALAAALAGCAHQVVPSTAPVPQPAAAEIESSLFLIGDAGSPDPQGEPVLIALRGLLAESPEKSLVLYLGDNLYPRGLPDSAAADIEEFRVMARRLDDQVDAVVQAGARGIFVPGNHDWDRFGPDGWNAIRREGDRLAERGGGQVELLPMNGCPGPEIVDRGRWIRLVLLDTQWWLHKDRKPVDASSGCATWDPAQVTEAIRAALRDAGERRVLVLGHHPLLTGGEHGGFFSWKTHLFPLRQVASWLWLPLPVLGSIYPIARRSGITSQDISAGAYRRLNAALTDAFSESPPVAYVAGHDHGLQVIEGGPAGLQLVSGAGIYGHLGELTRIKGTVLALSRSGFMRVDVAVDGTLRLAVITVDSKGTPTEVYSRVLGRAASEK